MPWYAQHKDGHPSHADSGSELEAVLVRLDYIEVSAPGSAEHEQTGEIPEEGEVAEQPADATNDSKPDPDALNRQRGHGGVVDEEFGG